MCLGVRIIMRAASKTAVSPLAILSLPFPMVPCPCRLLSTAGTSFHPHFLATAILTPPKTRRSEAQTASFHPHPPPLILQQPGHFLGPQAQRCPAQLAPQLTPEKSAPSSQPFYPCYWLPEIARHSAPHPAQLHQAPEPTGASPPPPRGL